MKHEGPEESNPVLNDEALDLESEGALERTVQTIIQMTQQEEAPVLGIYNFVTSQEDKLAEGLVPRLRDYYGLTSVAQLQFEQSLEQLGLPSYPSPFFPSLRRLTTLLYLLEDYQSGRSQ